MKFYVHGTIFSIALLFSAQQVAADWPMQLTGGASRPTISDIKDALGGWPGKSPGTGVPVNVEAQLYHYDRLAEAIVNFEYAFPGGTYAFLGRDSAVVADAFDAFYQAIGEKGRAIHLNASTESFARRGDRTLTKFLESNGLDFQDPLIRPFVMADTTSYSTKSQSRKLLSAAYRRLVRSGFKPKDLMRKVNFVSFTQGYPIDRATDYFRYIQVDKNGPRNILQIAPGLATYTTTWHDPFQPFVGFGDKIYAPPGRKNRGVESAILEEMYVVATVVSSPQFVKKVIDLARQRNVSIANGMGSFVKAYVEGKKLKDLLYELKREGKVDEATQRSWFSGDYTRDFLTILPDLQRDGFSVRELRSLARILIFDQSSYVNFLKGTTVKSKEEFLELVTPLSTGIEDEYRFTLDEFIIKNLATFRQLGATPEDILTLEARSLKRRFNKVILWYTARNMFRSPKDVLVLFRNARPDMGTPYQEAKEKFILDTVIADSAGEYPWALEESVEIQKLLTRENTSIEFLKIVFKRYPTVEGFKTLLSYYLVSNTHDPKAKMKENVLKQMIPIVEAEILKRKLIAPGIDSFVKKFSDFSTLQKTVLKDSKTVAEFFVNAKTLNDAGIFANDNVGLLAAMKVFSSLKPSPNQVEDFRSEFLRPAFVSGIDKMHLARLMMNTYAYSYSAETLLAFYQTPELAAEWIAAFFRSMPDAGTVRIFDTALNALVNKHVFTVAQASEILVASANYTKWSYTFANAVLPKVTDPENLGQLETTGLRLDRRLLVWYQARTLLKAGPKPIQCSTLLGI